MHWFCFVPHIISVKTCAAFLADGHGFLKRACHGGPAEHQHHGAGHRVPTYTSAATSRRSSESKPHTNVAALFACHVQASDTLFLFCLGSDNVWRRPDDAGHCHVTRPGSQHGATVWLSWGLSPLLLTLHGMKMWLNVSQWCEKLSNYWVNFSLCFRKQHVGVRKRTGEPGRGQRRRRPVVWSVSWRPSRWIPRSFMLSRTPCCPVASTFSTSCPTQCTDSVTYWWLPSRGAARSTEILSLDRLSIRSVDKWMFTLQSGFIKHSVCMHWLTGGGFSGFIAIKSILKKKQHSCTNCCCDVV